MPTRPATDVRLETAQFALTLSVGAGLTCRIEHRGTGIVLADGPYSYSFGDPEFDVIEADAATVVLRGATDRGLVVTHRFDAFPDGWLEEQLAVENTTDHVLDLTDLRCGFVLPVDGTVDRSSQSFSAIPFLREPFGNRRQYAEFGLDEVLTLPFSSRLFDKVVFTASAPEATADYAAEAWSWNHPDQRFVVSKYSPIGFEWALVDRLTLPGGALGLRWGGTGIYRGNPESAAWLAAGATHRFGVTRLTAVDGDLRAAYRAFRDERSARGHGLPADFDPPVHWNELYDNKLFSLAGQQQDEPEMRAKYYSLADMREEAAKAVAYSCEALYLDPGWDTNFASKIWDTARLGPVTDFIRMMRDEYGLAVSFHAPLSGWNNASSYDPSCYRMDRGGERETWTEGQSHFFTPICGASDQYVNETLERFSVLAEAGAAFFMFDGTMNIGECWDPEHGHAVPARLEAHVEANVRLARLVHERYPDVLIEMHDPAIGGFHAHYSPMYYGHGRAPEGARDPEGLGFDTAWAFELMWNPLEDLMSGRGIALYYYNLGYELPLYIHIDLRTDNEHSVVLWWNASTCRHLGIGGTHADPAVAAAHRASMGVYRRLKPYYVRGRFFGIDEQTHVHTDPDGGQSAVLNCFNLDDDPVTREIVFQPAEFELDPTAEFVFTGADFTREGDGYRGRVTIPGRGHLLVEVSAS